MAERERWGSRFAFIMAAVGSAVGLGNVWRFPYVAYENGGGAFFIPYLVALLTAGIPVMMLEYALGMKYQAGTAKALGAISKRFKWVGWLAMFVGLSISFYYVVIMAYSWHYMVASVTRAWENPTSNQTVFKYPYILVENEDEKKYVMKNILLLKKKISKGEKVDADRNFLTSKALERKDIDNFIKEVLKCCGGDTLCWKTPGEVVDYARAFYDKGYKTRFEFIRPRVLIAPYEDCTRCEKMLAEFYNSCITDIKEGPDKAAELRIPEEKKIRLITFDQNPGFYLNDVCLGGFEAKKWMRQGAKNQKLDAIIAQLKADDMAFEELDGKFITGLSVEANELYKILEVKHKDNPIKPLPLMSKMKLAEVLESYYEANASEVFSPVVKLIFWSLLTWVIIFLVIFKGVHVVGKVVMFTVPLPILCLGILIIYGMTLKGAGAGIEFLLSPRWELIKDPKVWFAAYGQIFFSLSLGFGILIAYASYMPKDSDVSNNAFMTAFANCATSFYASFAVFSVLGYLAMAINAPVQDVIASGPGLVFVTYPIALSQMGWVGSIVGVLFFFSLLTLGIDSAFSIVEAVVTGIHDYFKSVPKMTLTAIICGVGFLISVFPYSLRSGMIWLDINDHWMGGYGLVFVGLLECIAVAYFSKIEDLREFINERSEIKIHVWWDVFIKVLTPIILIYLLMNQAIADATKCYSDYDTFARHSVNIWGWGYFGVLFILAFIVGKNYIGLVGVGMIAVIAFFLSIVCSVSLGGSAMAGFAGALLFGGFIACLRIAMRPKEVEKEN